MTPEQLEALAKRVLRDPVLMGKLCDRIYHLLKTDQRYQQDRNRRQP